MSLAGRSPETKKLINQAHARIKAACGPDTNTKDYQAHLEADRDFIDGVKLIDQADRVGRFSRIVRIKELFNWFHLII